MDPRAREELYRRVHASARRRQQQMEEEVLLEEGEIEVASEGGKRERGADDDCTGSKKEEEEKQEDHLHHYQQPEGLQGDGVGINKNMMKDANNLESPPTAATTEATSSEAAAASSSHDKDFQQQSLKTPPPPEDHQHQLPAAAAAPAAASAIVTKRDLEEECSNHEMIFKTKDEEVAQQQGQGQGRQQLGGGKGEEHEQGEAQSSQLGASNPTINTNSSSSTMMSMIQDLGPDMMPQSMPTPDDDAPEEPVLPGAFAHSGRARFACPPSPRLTPAPRITQLQQANQQLAPLPPLPQVTTTRTTDDHDDLLELQEATLVDETELYDDEMGGSSGVAQPVDRKAERRKRRQRRKAREDYRRFLRCLCYLITFAVICSTIGMGIQIYYGVQDHLEEEENNEADKDGDSIKETSSSPSTLSTIPSFTSPPTNGGILAADNGHEDFVSTLPNSTMHQLTDPLTIQTQAFYWLLEHPEIAMMEDWRKTQLFALACIYYGLKGDMPNWPEPASRSWLDYERNECYWFSSSVDGYGTVSAASQGEDSYPSCNEEGQFIRLDLAGLKFAPTASSDNDTPVTSTTTSTTMKLPPEVALLSNLRHIWLWDCNIHQVLNDFLPVELYQMTSLESILLNGNAFEGSIPPQLLLPPASLKALDLSHNILTGSLPVPASGQIIPNHNLEWLSLSNNTGLMGTIPEEIAVALSSSLKHFDITGTSLTGTMPQELCSMMEVEEEEEETTSSLCLSSAGVEWLPYHHRSGLNNKTNECYYLGFDCSEQLCGCDCPCIDA